MDQITAFASHLPEMNLQVATLLLVVGFTFISVALGVAGQVEAGQTPPRSFMYKLFVSDAESYKQYRPPFRAFVAVFLVLFYIIFLFGPPYLIYQEMFGGISAAVTECVATKKGFGGLQCSEGCVAQRGKCVPR